MNRSALCIQMLHILYGRTKPISKLELAQLLETNPRNINEFKKELETAGYVIVSTTGKYGGYTLKEESIFPSLALSTEEIQSLQEANEYLKQNAQFLYYPPFSRAIDKFKAKAKSQSIQNELVYLQARKTSLSEEENAMWKLINQAKEKQFRIQFSYCSATGVQFEERIIEPYEMIVNDDGFYVLAYDISPHKKPNFKFFKIASSRMKKVKSIERKFARERDFKVYEHTGKHTLMKEMIEVEMKVQTKQARLILEKGIDNLLEQRWEKTGLYIRFMMEGEIRVKQFLLSLGKDAQVLSPMFLVEEIKEELKLAIQRYEE